VDDLMLRERFLEAFLERYFPVERALPGATPPGSDDRVRSARGWYRGTAARAISSPS